MRTVGIIALCIFGASVIAGLVSAILINRQIKKRPPKNQYAEEAQIVSTAAAVSSKNIEKQMTGSYFEPGHRVLYLLSFKTADGENKNFEVSTAVYDGLSVGDSGLLVYQGERFLGFECAAEGTAARGAATEK